jgi:hypothetical protein
MFPYTHIDINTLLFTYKQAYNVLRRPEDVVIVLKDMTDKNYEPSMYIYIYIFYIDFVYMYLNTYECIIYTYMYRNFELSVELCLKFIDAALFIGIYMYININVYVCGYCIYVYI